MSADNTANKLPTLPQQDNAEEQDQREFGLTLARTAYNYMFSYVEPVPLSADLPKGEGFTLDYEAKVLETFLPMADNFKNVLVQLLEKELQDDISADTFKDIEAAYKNLKEEFSVWDVKKDISNLEEFIGDLAKIPDAIKHMVNIPKDIEKMATGLKEVFDDFIKNGPTAFLKSSMNDMLSTDHGRDYLQAKSVEDYEALFDTIQKPLMLTMETKPWMQTDSKPCEQDWFFGYLQIAGFNTTNLRGIQLAPEDNSHAIKLETLLKKLPVTDDILQQVTGDTIMTLDEAARQQRLYAVDYSVLEGAKTNKVHGEQRYLGAPIALFYWNPNPPEGYPPGDGVLQPIAIQLEQTFDEETTPIFTPNDCANSDDPNGLKWSIAKYFVNVSCAIQHEAVAHLGDCHLIIEPIVVASHRQLSENHPLLKLLIPHFRFTININDDAIHSLIIPGGVVATNVGPAISSTLELISLAHKAWRWDDNNPSNVFHLRGLDKLPDFPFRDDTLQLWTAIQEYVTGYVKTYYKTDEDVINDKELQGWINEMTSPLYAGFKGLHGLTETDNAKQPVQINSVDYLVQVVAQIIYIAGPQHASVNYAQYPLMSYMPSVAGTIYKAPPSKSTQLKTKDDCIPWYPPLDVSIYTFSFEYLLSGVQYDTFGHYSDNARSPYFNDTRVHDIVAELHGNLSIIETDIRKKNLQRPMPYPFQLPSLIPNSISI